MSDPTPTARAAALRAVGLVTAREIRARVMSRSFVSGTVISLIVILGLLLTFGRLNQDHDHTVAVTGVSSAVTHAGSSGEDDLTWRHVPDEAQARHLVEDRDVDAALVTSHGHTRLLVHDGTSEQAKQEAVATVQRWATSRALREQHVDTEQLSREVAAALPRTETVGGPARSGAALGAAIGIVSLLFFQIFGSGMLVAQGVVEEKSTRVVEVLLSTLTPLRLMIGKVAGIGVAAFLQIATFGVGAFAAIRFGHVLPATFPTAPAILVAVGWFVLGFFFFAFLFAAAGSLVSRAEEVQSTVMPVLLLTMVPFAVAIAAAEDLEAPWVHVIRYIPPFSMLVLPLEVSVHAAGWGTNLIAALLMVVAAALLAIVAGGVYRRSILRTGAPLNWRQGLAG